MFWSRILQPHSRTQTHFDRSLPRSSSAQRKYPTTLEPLGEQIAGCGSDSPQKSIGEQNTLHNEVPECQLSSWSTSALKRVFDIVLVFAFTPVLLPVLLSIAFVVLGWSGAPILFRQRRIGILGRSFTIYKFRTMEESDCGDGLASMATERLTPIGLLLRRFKLDELPQVFNVLIGDMSLVGPRPKIPEQQLFTSACRPGITGPATLAFAREDVLFAEIPAEHLANYYETEVLPRKQLLDFEYMTRASMLSDLTLIVRTVTGQWGGALGMSNRLGPKPDSMHRDICGAEQFE